MTVKEMAYRELLTGTATYSEIAKKIRAAIAGAKTSEKSIAYYAHQLRKADKTCLKHRKASGTTAPTTAELIKKYKQK